MLIITSWMSETRYSITKAFKKVNVDYDIIFEDSSHVFEDQVRVVEMTIIL